MNKKKLKICVVNKKFFNTDIYLALLYIFIKGIKSSINSLNNFSESLHREKFFFCNTEKKSNFLLLKYFLNIMTYDVNIEGDLKNT